MAIKNCEHPVSLISTRSNVRAKKPGEIDQHLTSAGGGVKLTIPTVEGKRPGFSFAATYAIPVFKSIAPADRSYGTIYLNGTIEY